jgi:dTDP-4-amino-4,6-dideoxygalactose transaminase
VSHSAALIERARHLATQARDPFPHYEHSDIGYNYRLSNLLAALGRAQLLDLDGRIDRRRSINSAYRRGLGDLPGIRFMPVAEYGEPNWWLTCVTVDPVAFRADRDQIRLALEAEDIESRPTWKPLHLQPAFAGAPSVGGAVCAAIFETGLCLPSGSALTEDQQARVVETVRSMAG